MPALLLLAPPEPEAGVRKYLCHEQIHILSSVVLLSESCSSSFSYLVAAVDGIHAGLPHALEQEGVAGSDGEQRQQVDGQEAVDDEDSLKVGRGKDLTAVRLRTKPVSFFWMLTHSYRDGQKQGTWRGKQTGTTGYFSFTGSRRHYQYLVSPLVMTLYNPMRDLVVIASLRSNQIINMSCFKSFDFSLI